MKSNKYILVTGGAGFIGSALIDALNQKGENNIVVCDLLANDEKWKNLVSLKFNDYIESKDLLSKIESSENFLKNCKTVYHLGACSSTTEKDASYLIRNNFEYTKKLSTAALMNGSRFIYASSAATYGDGSYGMDDKDENINKYKPLNMYGYSKHLFDLYAQKAGILDQIVGIKYFNVFGPNENHKGDMRSLVSKAYYEIKETQKLRLFKSYHSDYADGEQMRDFLYVKDAVDITLSLGEHKGCGGIYNVGSGEANTWLSLASAIFKAMGLQMNIEFIVMPEVLKDKYQYYTCAEISKLRNMGYEKKMTCLEDAVADYIQNYLAKDKYLGE